MKNSFAQLEKLTDALSDAEYRFLFLEPILLYGIAFGIIGFIVSYFLKADKLQITALIFVAVSSFVFLPYINARSSAQPRLEKVYNLSAPSRAKTFADNTWLWKKNTWVYYALAAAAVATVLVGARRNRLGLIFGIATVSLGLLAMKNSAWMHYSDALAYHPTLKTNNAPVKEKLRAKPVKTAKAEPAKLKPTVPASTERIKRPVAPLSAN